MEELFFRKFPETTPGSHFRTGTSYVVRSRALAQLLEKWKARVRPGAFKTNQPLLDALQESPHVQWFYYCDDDAGNTFRLYDDALITRFLSTRMDPDQYVIVRGKNVGEEGTAEKNLFLQDFESCTPADEYNLRRVPANENKDDVRRRFFEARNQGEARDDNPMDNKAFLPSHLAELLALCKQCPQIILYGPPGTGKTRLALRLATALLEGTSDPEELRKVEKSEDDQLRERLKKHKREDSLRHALVVFHPAYEYEQFVGGIAPSADDRGNLRYEVQQGIFLRLCIQTQSGQKSVLIIDEINRGSLPKLLGELVFALEYRDHPVSLPFRYKDRLDKETSELIIPRDLIVIGTMNSSDRSIGHIDVAIRRRFALYRVSPDESIVETWWRDRGEAEFGVKLGEFLRDLNKALRGDSNDELLVGHSYFLGDSKKQVRRKWEYQVLPLLKEYGSMTSFSQTRLEEYEVKFKALLE